MEINNKAQGHPDEQKTKSRSLHSLIQLYKKWWLKPVADSRSDKKNMHSGSNVCRCITIYCKYIFFILLLLLLLFQDHNCIGI